MKPKFLNTPWRVERSAGELLVIDSKNMIVVGLPISDLEDLPGTVEDEENKAYAIAALPELYLKATDFLAALADPVNCLDEEILLRCTHALEAAIRHADIPLVEVKK